MRRCETIVLGRLHYKSMEKLITNTIESLVGRQRHNLRRQNLNLYLNPSIPYTCLSPYISYCTGKEDLFGS